MKVNFVDWVCHTTLRRVETILKTMFAYPLITLGTIKASQAVILNEDSVVTT